MDLNFTTKFIIDRTNGIYQIVLTDTSNFNGLDFVNGFWRIEYPDGIFVENTDQNNPDFTIPSRQKIFSLRQNNGLIYGNYKITQKVYSNTGYAQNESLLEFSFKEPDLILKDDSNTGLPFVSFLNETNTIVDFYSVVNLTQTISSSFPQGVIANPLSTTGSSLEMISGGNYYEGKYAPSLSINSLYSRSGHSVQYINQKSFAFDVKKIPDIQDLVEILDVLKNRLDNSSGQERTKLEQAYQQLVSLFSHVLAKINAEDEGAQELVNQMIKIAYSACSTCFNQEEYQYSLEPLQPFNDGRISADLSDFIEGDGIVLEGSLVKRIFGLGNVTIKHADTSEQQNVGNSGGNVIQSISVDSFGHITLISSANLDNRYLREELDPVFLSWLSSNPFNGFATETWVNTNFYNKTQSDNRFYPLSSNPAGYLLPASLAPYATTSYVNSNFYPLNSNPAGYLTSSSITGLVPYTGANNNVNLGEFGIRTGYVQYDTTPTNTPTTQGTTYWDVDDNTLAIIMNGAIQKVGEDTFYPVKNQTGSSIPKGTAVRFAGTLGASGRLLIAPFIANGTYPSITFMGVTAENIADGADGKVYWFGRIRGIDTSGYSEGDVLYASSTVAGGFTTTPPQAPNNIISVCAVITSHATNGVIFVRPQIGSNINNDEGVKITSIANGDILQYIGTTGLFENKTKAQYLGGTSSQFVKGDGSLDSTAYALASALGNYQLLSEKGTANGYASLDSNGKVPLTQINDALLGNVNFQGLWNASTNTPTLDDPPSSSTKGHYYIVTTAGTQFGIDYEVGDWVISNGSSWNKVDNTDAVSSVFGRTGNIVGVESDYQSFYPRLSQSYTNPSWIASLPWSKITDTPTTLAGYGITDALTGDYLPLSGGTLTGGLIGTTGSFASSGSANTFTINHSSGSGVSLNILKAGNGEGLVINKTSGSGNAATIIGTLEATVIKKTNGTSSQFLKADGSVDSNTYATTSQLHSPVTLDTANGLSLNGQILSLGLASVSSAGALSATDWNTFNNKQNALGFTPVPTTRILTINGVSFDLSTDRSWTIPTGIGGSGTSNFIPKFTPNGTSLGNSSIFNDGDNIGIGIIIPTSKLEISNGDIKINDTYRLGWRYTSGDSNMYNWIENSYQSGIIYKSGSWTSSQSIVSHDFQTYSANIWQSRLQIIQNGNVLINTTNDNGNRLQVNGAATFSSSVTAVKLITTLGQNTLTTISNFSYIGKGDNTFYSGFNFQGISVSDMFFGRAANADDLIISQSGIASPKEIIRFTQGGNVLIGTTSEVAFSGTNGIIVQRPNAAISLSSGATASASWLMYRADSDATLRWFNGADRMTLTSAGNLSVTGDIVAFSTSDIRLKNNLTHVSNALENINKLGGYTFDWSEKQDTYTGKDYGIIAQEVEGLFPEMVTTRDNGYKAVKYDRLIPVMIEAIKELSDKVKTLEGGK
jgi:hypothetical protein